MISFECDYTQGAHPQIMQKLLETNLEHTPGYGMDPYCEQARQKIRAACGFPDADVFFLLGGTQANATVISAMLQGWQGVLAAATGHIAVHEAGAVEFTGHKVLTLPGHGGLMDAGELEDWLKAFYADGAHEHMVFPGMVYLSFPSEYGTLYSQAQLTAIREVCLRYRLPLFIDGARLGYGLMSPGNDISLHELSSLCDVFYIGGTKVGALMGEAVVFPQGNAPAHFFTTIKQHGALLAKGRLLGIQFDTLFTDGLYFEISRHAVEMAMRLRAAFLEKGYTLFIDSPTNQQFFVLDQAQMDRISAAGFRFEIWEPLPGNPGHFAVRFATSWATTKKQVDALAAVL